MLGGLRQREPNRIFSKTLEGTKRGEEKKDEKLENTVQLRKEMSVVSAVQVTMRFCNMRSDSLHQLSVVQIL